MRTRASALLLALALLGLALPGAAFADNHVEPQTSMKDLEDEVMCVICGVPLEKSLDAPAAQRERAFIEAMIAEGATKQEIKDALVAEYGETVLAVPPTSGFGLTAWLVPAFGFAIAATAVFVAVRRWRRETVAEAEADHEDKPSAQPLSAEEEQRLDTELGDSPDPGQ